MSEPTERQPRPTIREESARLLEAGYRIAELQEFTDVDTAAVYSRYAINHARCNFAIQYDRMAAITVDLTWGDPVEAREKIAPFDNPNVPKITIPHYREAWLFRFDVPYESLKSGGIRGTGLELVAMDAPWCGVLAPGSQVMLLHYGLQYATWRDEGVIVPCPVSDELAKLLDKSSLIYR